MPPKPPSPEELTARAEESWRAAARRATPVMRELKLVAAAEQGRSARVAFLLAEWAALKEPHVLGRAATAAAINGHADTCRLLLRHGAPLDYAHGALIEAAVAGNNGDLVDFILRAGASFEMKGRRPLLEQALSANKPAAAKALILHGANPYRQNAAGKSMRQLAEDIGRRDLAELMERLWQRPPLVPAGFAAETPLEALRGSFPAHDGMTGFQLAACHGQIDALFARLIASQSRLHKSDVLTANLRHPRTLLFILGQRGEAAKAFDPALWGGDLALMQELLRYVPAAFRAQIDEDAIRTKLQQRHLQQGRPPRLPRT
jgi:hypothetical protein